MIAEVTPSTRPRRGMRRLTVAIAVAALCLTSLGPGSVTGAPKPPPACSLVPQLRDVTVNQGVGAYTPLVRGKETLVRAYLAKPTCAAAGAIIELTGGSLSVTAGTAAAVTIAAPTPRPTAPFPQLALATSAPLVDSTADPVWIVPGSALAPSTTTARFTATFRVTITYQSKASATATAVPGTVTFTSRSGSTTPITATVEKLTNALRVLVVPMGDASRAFASQYTASGDAALQAAMLTLSRIYPVPEGVGSLTGTAGGLRYSVSPGMLDLRALLGTDGRFCGSGGSAGNFNAIKASLGQFLQSWNAANGSANQADRVLGVVDAAISNGSAQGCAEGMAAINSNEAWIRAVPELQGVPSQSGFVAALELGHTFGLVLGGPSPTPDRDDLFSKYHSPNVYADPQRTNRSYNTRLRSVLVDDRTAMTYIGTANNNNTLLEQLDWAYLICRLGGATSTECPAPAVPVGSGAGVAAGPRFVISGVTDGTVDGTSVLESFFSANMLPTPQIAASPYRLVYRSASGAILSNFGLPVQAEDSAHSHDDDGPATGNLTLFSGAFDFPGTPNRIELWRGAPGSGVLLYARDRTAPPVIEDLSVTADAGGTANFTNDSENIDFAPALSADGRWLAWAAFFPTEGTPSIAIRVAPVDDVSAQTVLNDDGAIDSSDPAWCADGGRIAYVDSDGDMWIVPVNTGGASAVFGTPTMIYDADLHGEMEASHPTWSPDCSQLAFEADNDIWRVDSDGTDVVALTNDDSSHDPAWSPDPNDNRIAFEVRGFSAFGGRMVASGGDATYASFVRPTPDEPIGVLDHAGLHIVVNFADDVVDGGGCDASHCSLREAIQLANATANVGGADVIEFAIGGSPPHFISPATPLPTILDPLEIDASTQAGYAAGAPVIVLDGTGAGVSATGLSITAGASTVRGLVIANFAGNSAIAISGSGGNRIEACFIGTDVTGTAAAANSIGVRVSGSPNNLIGGTVAGAGNVISGNSSRNVAIESSASTGNLIAGNRIGTNAAGTARLVATDQFHIGIQIANAADNTVGGTTSVERNVISGNGYGLMIAGATASGNVILGNYIGTDVAGSTSVSNERVGVIVLDGHDNIIGGTAAGAGNVISGNSSGPPPNLYGISFSGATTTANLVQGNLIGLAADGTTALPNKGGIEVNGAPANIIGGTVAGARNVISGNLGFGFNIGNPGATGTIIRGNYIGTDITGLLDRGNSVGINAADATGTIVGGSVAGAGNVISGNFHGVFANTGADGTVIRGNLIGTDATGTGALGNTGNGVIIVASNVSVGGVLAADANVIANNGAAGVTVGTNTITPIGNRINQNSIDANGGLGIDLAPTGTNLNDADDSDVGVNGLQNFPVVTDATGDGVTTSIDGTLTSTADTSFRIEAFASDTCDNSGSGHGEGARFLGATTVVTDESGTGSFTFSGITNAAAPVGDFITTTATDQGSDNTSEFSACLVVSSPPGETATFTVNSTNDADDGICGTVHCSLREAINRANSETGADTISFGIPGSGQQTIAVFGALPEIEEAVEIDGTTQPGYVGTPLVVVNGAAAGITTNGLVIGSAAAVNPSTIEGLAVVNFGGIGIDVQGEDASILGNYVGTANGIGAAANGTGVQLGTASLHAEIRDNLISGNTGAGVEVSGDEHQVMGNRIGTTAGGDFELPNGGAGILVQSGINIDIGSEVTADQNLISGNIGPGIVVLAQASIQGNRIGTGADGTSFRGNDGGGIVVDGGNVLIGGIVAGMGNLISGNFENGITVLNDGFAQISGNLIGTEVTGTAPLGNTTHGIEVADAAATIGGPGNDRNVISGNNGYGILIREGPAIGLVSTVGENYIGTNITGTAAIGNAVGVVVTNTDSQVVGDDSGGSVISGNNGPGIIVNGTSTGTEIGGNRIGLNFSSDVAIPNGDAGIYIASTSSGTLIGGDTDLTPGLENRIGGNTQAGVVIDGSDGNVVQGNLIGTNSEFTDLGNGGAGVSILNGGQGNRVGADQSGTSIPDAAANIIAFNAGDGVEFVSDGALNASAEIHSNSIFDNGGLGIDLEADGVTPNDTGTPENDPDVGANDLTNFPDLIEATTDGTDTVGTITSTTAEDALIIVYQLFVSTSCDPTGNGEGERYLTTLTTNSDNTGFAEAPFSIPEDLEGMWLTATTSDVNGLTSEFSECFEVQADAGFGDEIHLLDPTTPLGTTDFVVNGFDPAWRAGSLLYATDDELHRIQPDGTGDEIITTGFADSSPSGGPGVTAFVRTQGGDDDIWLIVDGETINVTASDQTPENLRLDLYYVCGGQSMPIAVALTPEITGVTTASFQANYDPSLSCAGGTIKAALTDGFLRTTTTGPGEPVASDPKPPVAATYGPPLGSTYLTSDVIPFHGIGEDADDGTLTGTSLRWFIRPASAPCCGTPAGMGGSVDFQASGLAPGDYIVTLLATDPDGQTDTAESLIHVIADSDHDGFSDAAETNTCFGAGAATNGSTPSGDADGDGLPNASDPEPCVVATVYHAIVDFNPNELNLSSSGNPVTISIQTPGRDIRQIVGSSVRIVEASGATTNLANMGWSVSGTVGTAKFARQPLVTFLKSNGVTTGTVWIVVSGTSNTNPAWTFTGRDTTNTKP